MLSRVYRLSEIQCAQRPKDNIGGGWRADRTLQLVGKDQGPPPLFLSSRTTFNHARQVGIKKGLFLILILILILLLIVIDQRVTRSKD